MTIHTDDPDEWSPETVRQAIEDGIEPSLLKYLAPTFPLAMLAFAYEQGEMANVAYDAMEGSASESSPSPFEAAAQGDERAAYWKGRMDAHASVRGQLAVMLVEYCHIDHFPLTHDELDHLGVADDDE